MNIKTQYITLSVLVGIMVSTYQLPVLADEATVTAQSIAQNETTATIAIDAPPGSIIRLPSGIYTQSQSATYTVSRNGTYDFLILSPDGVSQHLKHTVNDLRANLLVTGTPDVELELTAEDLLSGVENMRFRNEATGDWSTYQPFSQYTDWTLEPVEGKKSVYAMFQDKAGNESVAVYDQIYLDLSGPEITPFTINNDDTYTRTHAVKLQISATDNYSEVQSLRISNDNNNWTTVPYQTEVDWTLVGSPGIKTVYIQGVDSLGNIGETVSDTIYLDDVLPTGSIRINNDEPITNSRNVKLQLEFADIHAGVKRVTVIEGANSYTFQTVPSSPTEIDWTLGLGNTATVTLEVEDNAGNIFRTTSSPITIATLEIDRFTLNDIANPISFPSSNPFEPIDWTFHPQPMLSGGAIEFDLRYTLDLVEPTTADITAEFVIDLIHEDSEFRHTITLPYTELLFSGFRAKVVLPGNAPDGTKVYISSRVQAVINDGANTFIDEAFFPGVGERAYIGDIIGNIKESIKFNEQT